MRSRNSFRSAAAIPAHGERHTARKRKRLHGVFRSSSRRSKPSRERCPDVNRSSGQQAHRGGGCALPGTATSKTRFVGRTFRSDNLESCKRPLGPEASEVKASDPYILDVEAEAPT